MVSRSKAGATRRTKRISRRAGSGSIPLWAATTPSPSRATAMRAVRPIGREPMSRWMAATSSRAGRAKSRADSSLSVQAYYDRTHRLIPPIFEENRDTFDLELEGRFVVGAHDVVYGANYRLSADRIGNIGPRWPSCPANDTEHLVSAYLAGRVASGAAAVRHRDRARSLNTTLLASSKFNRAAASSGRRPTSKPSGARSRARCARPRGSIRICSRPIPTPARRRSCSDRAASIRKS